MLLASLSNQFSNLGITSQNQFKIKVFNSERNSQRMIYQWGKLHLVPGHCVKSEICLLTVNKAEKYFKD